METKQRSGLRRLLQLFRRTTSADSEMAVTRADPPAVPGELPAREARGQEPARSLESSAGPQEERQEESGNKQEVAILLDRWKTRGDTLMSESKLEAQLPLFPEEKRPVSNDMARSALFSCVQGKDRQMLDDVLLATIDGVEIRFSGKQFNQDDHDVLMQLVHMAKHKPLGEYVTLPANAILRALNRKTGKSQHKQLRDDIARLVNGGVSLRDSKRKIEYIGHLIDRAVQDENSRHWVYKFNPDLRVLYGNSVYTLIDWDQRHKLRGKDLARWLHLYLSTHAMPFPVKVATLKNLSGSRTGELKKFRQLLRSALDDLKAISAIEAWEIDKNDLVHVNRGKSITDSQRRHLAKLKSSEKEARH